MREFLYISRSKLDRFLDERNFPRFRAVFNRFEISIANLLKVGISRAPLSQDAASLENIMKRIDQLLKSVEYSNEPALWWDDDDAQVGDWIQFDTEQKYVNTSNYFLSWSSDPSSGNRQPGSVLLLHGSARHIVGSVQFWETPRFGEGRRIGGPAGGSEPQLPVSIKEELKPFLRWKTGRNPLPGPWPAVKLRLPNPRDLVLEFHLRKEDDLADLVSMLLEQGEGTINRGNLAGFARVTSIYNIGAIYLDGNQLSTASRLITATPLYVERLAAQRG